MLRIDHPCARSRETEPGADPGFPERQRNYSVRRRNSSADLSAEPLSARFVTQLCGEDDGPEPGAGDAVDRSLSENWIAAVRAVPPSSFSAALYPRRHRTAGHRR